MIDADEADVLVGAWLLGLVHTGRLAADQAGAVLAIALDGKTLKGSWEELRTGQVKLFSALVHGEGVIVGQRKVPRDTTEVTQVLPLLDDIRAARAAAGTGTAGDLSHIVFTADALHVHRDNIQQLTDQGGEYVLTVKGNQPTLERDIAALFPSAVGAGDFPAHHTTFDRGHGRIEIRSIWCTSNVAGLDFPGVFQAFRIHRQTFDLCFNPIRKPETVHGITSLTAWQANPADILAHNRGHWEVENREHYVRDRTFDEDRSQVRTGASPQFMATARNIAISLLRLAGCTNIARGLEHLSRRLDHVLALLGA
jgi:predicted transposase YbfD/YdcC